MKSVAFSGWTNEDQLQIWSSHSLILHVYVITYTLSVYKGNIDIFSQRACHSRKINVAACFVVLPNDIEIYVDYREGYIYIIWYIYIFLGIMYSRSFPLFIEIYQRVGDKRRAVNTSASPHISDQMGTENLWETMLCWFIVMLWVLVCKNIYRYESHFGSFHRYSSLLSSMFGTDCAIELTKAGSRSGKDIINW